MDKYVIITGSSGFIGKNLVVEVINSGYRVIGVDAKPQKVMMEGYTHFIIDLTDKKQFDELDRHVDNLNVVAVFHLAAKIKVDKAVSNPEKYYSHNIIGSLNLLEFMKKHGIFQIIFSSTAVVYGNILSGNGYREEEAGGKLSVYGRTKLQFEEILQDYTAHGFKGYIFRFFNVAGEYPDKTPCHLIDIIVKKIHKRENLMIFGSDYETRDGTCVRDYIHIKDIISAFKEALVTGFDHNYFKIYNLGSNIGYSVKEIIERTLDVSIGNMFLDKEYIYSDTQNSQMYHIVMAKRRPGDFAVTIADTSKIKREMSWKCKCSIDEIILDTINSYILKLIK